MRERFLNALRGFGFVTNDQVLLEVEAIDRIPKLNFGQRRVSQWGGSRFRWLS